MRDGEKVGVGGGAIETDRESQRETERERDRQTDRQTDRDRVRGLMGQNWVSFNIQVHAAHAF